MAYIKYKEITKYFYFSNGIETEKLPVYTKEYIYKGEVILDCYKTKRDYGIFTDKKILLFDRIFDRKEITIIPYNEITAVSIIFKKGKAELLLYLSSGYPLRLKFVNMKSKEKTRLRNLYYCISKIINNQGFSNEDIDKLNLSKNNTY